MSADFQFYFRPRGGSIQRDVSKAFFLTQDNWNDFGSKIQFELSYVNSDLKRTEIGAIKIMRKIPYATTQIITPTTEIPHEFSSLSSACISLGQTTEYYTILHRLLGREAGDALSALRDIAWEPALAADFEPFSIFRNAMMRENGARRARRFGRSLALGHPIQEKPSFEYICDIEGADVPIELEIDFQSEDRIPGRISGIIGRNAVGKTRFMAQLSADLAQISRVSAERLISQEQRFPKGQPLFTRVIAISYSAFDKFKRPSADASSSYVYCGIRDDRGGLNHRSLNVAYNKNKARVRELELEKIWAKHMQSVLDDFGDLTEQMLADEIGGDAPSRIFDMLSSGQAILCHFVTALLAWIQPTSLVLFDEPETHLHPNAVASLFIVLSDVLHQFDSYAIVATHSPVVIQEIPGKRVTVFSRTGNVTVAEQLSLESFGESVSELTRHVFETIEVESLYKKVLKDLAQNLEAEEILSLFENGLSLNAQAYLLAQYGAEQAT